MKNDFRWCSCNVSGANSGFRSNSGARTTSLKEREIDFVHFACSFPCTKYPFLPNVSPNLPYIPHDFLSNGIPIYPLSITPSLSLIRKMFTFGGRMKVCVSSRGCCVDISHVFISHFSPISHPSLSLSRKIYLWRENESLRF